jgi:hypothetical protein
MGMNTLKEVVWKETKETPCDVSNFVKVIRNVSCTKKFFHSHPFSIFANLSMFANKDLGKLHGRQHVITKGSQKCDGE